MLCIDNFILIFLYIIPYPIIELGRMALLGNIIVPGDIRNPVAFLLLVSLL